RAENGGTPAAGAGPNAEPPVSTTAPSRVTVRVGSSSAVSRAAGAPPRTSPEATVPSGSSTTVQPVRARRSVQCPTRTPGTSVITLRSPPSPVAARDPRADRADDLVGDRPEPARPLARRDPLLALGAEQHDPVAHRHVALRTAVDHELVHRPDADHGPPPRADPHPLRR